tara:strand:+ start:597 stop:1736 length:1140 start_codon:yes stop_codon:yes gene_type:complete
MKRILFITHDMSRSGAPIVLLHFLRWLRKNQPETILTLLSLKEGELKEEFEGEVDNFYLLSEFKKEELTFLKEVKKKFLKKIGRYSQKSHPKDVFLKKLAFQDFDLVYANTIVSIPTAINLKSINENLMVVAHIHELNSAIKILLPNLGEYLNDIDGFISASNLVKNNLVNKYQVPFERIKTIYEFSEVRLFPDFLKNKEYFIVGGAGKGGWRKGTDLFIHVAKYIKSYYPEYKIKFQWIGKNSVWEDVMFRNDLEKANLEEIVNFLGEIEIPDKKFADFDVFLMTSREDPFPLVCIETGMLGKPIIGFKGVTGTEEVLLNHKDNFVSYLNIEQMAKKIVYYYDNRNILKKDSKSFESIFSNYTPAKICPMLYKHLRQI